jgi:hypothetical protein
MQDRYSVPAVGVPGATRHGRSSACIVLLRHDHWTHTVRSVVIKFFSREKAKGESRGRSPSKGFLSQCSKTNESQSPGEIAIQEAFQDRQL